ncbi:magnesium and cobalt transport protein CorA [Pilimelia columellifera]|uniref:Magnesium/cobalt transporter CorA n=1 Tax=Pilimelia columellifera subsp. columellifera TaxID=706583 RepID=A0ABN3NBR3_9ACTN
MTGGAVQCTLYADGRPVAADVGPVEALAEAHRRPGSFVWLNLHEPDDALIADVSAAYSLHDLSSRTRLDQVADEVSVLTLGTVAVVAPALRDDEGDIVATGTLTLIVGPAFVITVGRDVAVALDPVRVELTERRRLMAFGRWGLAYAIADHVVAGYLDVLEQLAQEINTLEEQVFAPGVTDGSVPHIYELQRELVEFRRAVVPAQRPLSLLVDGVTADVPSKVRRYLHGVLEHLTRALDQINSYDDLLNSILQARLAQVSVDQNNDMRKIASWAAIAATQTVIAGVYGMNFRHMPELGWHYGYLFALSVMIGAGLLLYWRLRRSGWL